jgi:hypothetical protein
MASIIVCFFVPDKALDQLPRSAVGKLLRRRFHEVTRGANQRATNASIHRQFGAADGIDDHPG